MLEQSQGGQYSEMTVNGGFCRYPCPQVGLVRCQERADGGTIDESEYVAVSRAVVYRVSEWMSWLCCVCGGGVVMY